MGKALNSIDSLTDRELEILQLIGRGIRTGAIASQLKISIKTVETYRSKLKEKLGVQDGAQLVKYAVEWAGRNAL
jgi:DNA-binding NarL/FixJ family response regulator